MIETITIDSPDDPRIAAYRQVKERDLVGRGGGFMIEGEVVLRAFARAGRHDLSSVLIDARRVEKLSPVLGALPPAPIYCAPQGLLDQIVGFPIHRGILAHGRRAPEATAADLLAGLPDRSVILALFGISNHDNMGALFRNAAAFGAAAVLLDPTCCDPLYRKAIRVSVGAALTIPFARLEGDRPVDLLAAHGFDCLAFSPNGLSTLAHVRRSDRVAVALGAEGPGLPATVLEQAITVAIPMADGFDSLNVATTCGIALHHLAFAAGAGEP